MYEQCLVSSLDLGTTDGDGSVESADKYESAMVVQRDGEVLCVSCSASDETGFSRLFHPFFDEDRRKALEDELMEAYVKESFTYTFQDGETVRCVFVIDSAPR
jgi:hypothetical protein